MSIYHNRLHVQDIRAMKARGEKISMLYVQTYDEASAAAAAGIHMLSIEGRFFGAAMREAAGDCFVQVGLPYGGWGSFNGRPLATAEDYLRAAFHYAVLGAMPITVRPPLIFRRCCATITFPWWVISV